TRWQTPASFYHLSWRVAAPLLVLDKNPSESQSHSQSVGSWQRGSATGRVGAGACPPAPRALPCQTDTTTHETDAPGPYGSLLGGVERPGSKRCSPSTCITPKTNAHMGSR